MVRETSQWEREEMEKVVSERESPLGVILILSAQQVDTNRENHKISFLQQRSSELRSVCYRVNEASPLHPT